MKAAYIKEFVKNNLTCMNNPTRLSARRTNKKYICSIGYQDIIKDIFDITSHMRDDEKFSNRIRSIHLDINNTAICEFCGEKFYFNKSMCYKLECKKLHRAKINIKQFRGKKHSEDFVKLRINNRLNNGKPWHTEKTKNKISESNHKTHTSKEFREKHTETYANSHKKLSRIMKQKIASGEFTPCITNSWANSRCRICIDGYTKFYRSSWDAAFQILNPNFEYEKVRIPYVSPIDNQWHNYIVDFVDENNKILYEIKPSSNKSSKIVLAKEKYAKEWCNREGYTFKFISEDYFELNTKLIDFDAYDEKIHKGMCQFL